MFFHFHPYAPFLQNNTKKVIVGTLPPPRFCEQKLKSKDVNFCYGSCDNLLWVILNQIFDLNLLFDNSQEAIKQRQQFLIQHQIGICDIVQSCYREKIDASDLGMSQIKLRDILRYLQQYRNIETLLFMGGNSKNGPEYFLRQLLKESNISFNPISEKTPKKHQFVFDNRVITTISLTSPSNAANRSIGANTYYKQQKAHNADYSTLDFRVKQYKSIFLE